MPDPLTQVRRARARFLRAQAGMEKAREELHDAIVNAHKAGASISAIARTLKVSRQYVSRLLERR